MNALPTKKTKDLINTAEAFVKEAFAKNPHFSFNDGSVMHNHSLIVKELSLEIAEDVPGCDIEVLAIAALLHDIGKKYPADEETLHYSHEDLNLTVSKEYISKLQIDEAKKKKIEEIISYKSDSLELKIIKDADTIALYKDKKLYMLFIEWASASNLDASIQRKLDKFDRLSFSKSKEIALPLLIEMKEDWARYLRKK